MRNWWIAAAAGISLIILSQWLGEVEKPVNPTKKTAVQTDDAAPTQPPHPLASANTDLVPAIGESRNPHAGQAGRVPHANGKSTDAADRTQTAFPWEQGTRTLPSRTAVSSAGLDKPVADEALSLCGIRLGDSEQQVTARLGKPVRRDPGPFGYDWLIYNRDPARYVQIGVTDGKVVDIYSNAPAAELGRVRIGTSRKALARAHRLEETVTFSHQGADIRITNQLNTRPLVLIDGTPAIFYLDSQNHHRVTAIRLIDKQPLLTGGFYEIRWSAVGELPSFDPPVLTIRQREAVNTAHARQLLDLVNVMRYRYKMPQLTWNEQVAKVARSHSEDMERTPFFDHVSATTGLDPFERLKRAGITYRMAGENIAAGFPDAIEAHESWMNSPGHRKNILEKGFREMGSGVSHDYYTQNFITRP